METSFSIGWWARVSWRQDVNGDATTALHGGYLRYTYIITHKCELYKIYADSRTK